jgi:hypothetical protein
LIVDRGEIDVHHLLHFGRFLLRVFGQLGQFLRWLPFPRRGLDIKQIAKAESLKFPALFFELRFVIRRQIFEPKNFRETAVK